MRLARAALGVALLALLAGCVAPPEAVLDSPDRYHRVEVTKTELNFLPFYRLTLRHKGSFDKVVIAEGLQSLCGVSMDWESPKVFKLRLPRPEAPHLKIDDLLIDGVRVRAELHEDFVSHISLSPNGRLRLVEIANCEGTQWDVYLREAGKPNYDSDMAKGWADQSVAGGFDQRRVLKSITWKDNSHAVLLIQGDRGQVQARDEVKGVKIKWKFLGGIESGNLIK